MNQPLPTIKGLKAALSAKTTKLIQMTAQRDSALMAATMLRDALLALVAVGMPAKARELELHPEREAVVVAKVMDALAITEGLCK